jgi:hypothetical protein
MTHADLIRAILQRIGNCEARLEQTVCSERLQEHPHLWCNACLLRSAVTMIPEQDITGLPFVAPAKAARQTSRGLES